MDEPQIGSSKKFRVSATKSHSLPTPTVIPTTQQAPPLSSSVTIPSSSCNNTMLKSNSAPNLVLAQRGMPDEDGQMPELLDSTPVLVVGEEGLTIQQAYPRKSLSKKRFIITTEHEKKSTKTGEE